MDRRSLDLNFENNILLYDPATTAAIQARQAKFLAQSKPVQTETVVQWPMRRRLWNNAASLVGPLL
jgi:cardiolipin synthase